MDKQYNFNEYLCYRVINDKCINNFFVKLYNYGKKIDQNSINDILKSFTGLANRYIKQENKLKKLERAIRKEGIVISEDNKKSTFMGVKKTTDGGFANNGKYETIYRSFPDRFNGLRMNDEILESKQNPYNDKYNEWMKKNAYIEEKIKDLEYKINDLQEKQMNAIFKKKKYTNQINELIQELQYCRENLKDGLILKRKKEIIDKLTKEQKELILQYLSAANECQKLCLDIKECVKKYDMITIKNIGKSNSLKWSKCFEEMLNNGDVTKEEIMLINEKFIPIFNQNDNSIFKERVSMYSGDLYNIELNSMIKWYTSHVFNNTVKSNNKPTCSKK